MKWKPEALLVNRWKDILRGSRFYLSSVTLFHTFVPLSSSSSFFVPTASHPRSQAFLSSSLSVTDDQLYYSFAFLPYALLSQLVQFASPSFSLSLSLFLSYLLFCTSLPFSIRPSSDNEKPSLRSKRETIGNATTIIARDFAFIAIKSRSERGWILISSLCSGTLFFYLCGSIEKIALAFPSSVTLLTLDITNLGFSHDQTRGSSCPAFSNSFSKYRSSSSTSIKISNVRDNLFVAIIRWLC